MTERARGAVAPGYEPVRDVFQSFFDKGWDMGSAVSVYRYGAPVVQLTGGRRLTADDTIVAYDASTIQLVASTTKFVESVCIALLVDRGLIRYDDHIVDHWPEFAGGHAGKGARHDSAAPDAPRRPARLRAQVRRRRNFRPRRASALPRGAAPGARALCGGAQRWRLEIATPSTAASVLCGVSRTLLVRARSPR